MLEAFRLDEDLVTLLLGETDDLVLDGRAIPRSGCLNLAGVHRRPVQIGPDELVGGRARVREMAEDLRQFDPVAEDRERTWNGVAGSLFHQREVDRVAGDPRGRP